MRTVRVSDQVEWRSIEDEVVVLDVRTELYLSFNDTGAVLWKSVAEGMTTDEMVERLVEAFEVEEAAARADVAAFVGELVERGLVQHVDSDGDPAS